MLLKQFDLKVLSKAQYEFLELPYPPVLTSVELSTSSTNAVDVAWTPGYDGNSPVLRFTIDLRVVVVGTLVFCQ